MLRALGLLGGEYRLGREIGRGSQGAVYVARAESSGELVAIKLLARFEPVAAARLRREAEVLLRLAPHRNVVRVLAAGDHGGLPYIVMEPIRGGSLLVALRAGWKPQIDQAVGLILRVLEGLAHLHAAGVVHRDLKPSNVLVDQEGEPRIVDFGLALETDRVTRLTATQEIVGSPFSLAPEQLLGIATPETDVYAAGALLYELLTGRPPYAEARTPREFLERLATVPPASPRSVNPMLPPSLADAVERALARSPDQRPRSAAAFARELESALEKARASGSATGGPSTLPSTAGPDLDALAPIVPGTVTSQRWTVKEELGRGGSGVVMRASPREGGPDVAIKFLFRPSVEARARFERERRILEDLGAGEGFVPVLASGEHAGAPYLVMPVVAGGSLRDRLARGPLSVAETLVLARKLARALAACHARGVVHRDMKPANVLFTPKGEPLIADLGLAKHFQDAEDEAGTGSVSLTKSGEFRGTPAYMPPEQMRDAKSATPASDVYMLGAMIFECLTGRLPHDAPTLISLMNLVMNADPPRLDDLRPDVPPWLARVVARALARDPALRYPDAAALLVALQPARTTSRRVGVAAAAVLAVLAAALVLPGASRPPPPVPTAPLQGASPLASEVWLDALDVSAIDQSQGPAQVARSVGGRPLAIASVAYAHGIGTRAFSEWTIDLGGDALAFHAFVGVDDEVGPVDSRASVVFRVVRDGAVVYSSPVMRAGMRADPIEVPLEGARWLRLEVNDAGDGTAADHGDWGEARIVFRGARPSSVSVPPAARSPIAPFSSLVPLLVGPTRIGARPSSPIDVRLGATSEAPVRFEVEGLPPGLVLEGDRIRGVLRKTAEHRLKVRATNKHGRAERELALACGAEVALTPPMGWNSGSTLGPTVDEGKVREIAERLVHLGLAAHGFRYVTLDEGWMDGRDSKGKLRPNPRTFTDMPRLAQDLHRLGLKLGLTVAPWRAGAFDENDVETVAAWGVDLLRCDYGRTAGEAAIPSQQRIAKRLRSCGRDVVLAISQDGLARPEGADQAVESANAWRTISLGDASWVSIARVGFRPFLDDLTRPGHWHDLGNLFVGDVLAWGDPKKRPTKLKPDEQHAHISLWCLRGSPLFLGGDPRTLDAFTLGLLTNDEVIAVNQDRAGRPARRLKQVGTGEVWVRELDDGSLAVGLFERSHAPGTSSVTWKELGLGGAPTVRDLWRRSDLGPSDGVGPGGFTTSVPGHGAVLVRIATATPR